MQSLEELRAMPHLSVSALKLYLSCPKKFQYRYVDRATASHRAIALVFGHAWHSLIGHVLILHQKQQSLREANLSDYFAAALRNELDADGPPVLFEDGENVDSLIATAMRMLSAFLDKVPLPQKVLRVELPFRLQLFDPDTGDALPVPLIGALDAVVENDGQIEIWELKSGKRRFASDAVLFAFQPTAYGMAMRSLLKERSHGRNVHLKLIVTTKASKCDVQVEDLVRTDSDERDLAETASSIIRATTAGCFHKVRSWQCAQCEFGDLCQ